MTKTPPVDAFAQARPIDLPFLLLNGAFLAPLLLSPLLDLRPVAVDLGFRVFVVPAGALTFAATFLVSNVVTEVYGRRRSNRVVLAGLFASVCAIGVLWVGEQVRSAAASTVADDTRGSLATATWRTVLGWLALGLAVQYANVGAFHLLRRATGGRHLWLRNGVAPIVAQLVVAALAVAVLDQVFPGGVEVAEMTERWYFEALLACASTPFCYAAVLLLQRWRARPL